ncbi:MAG: xanthine dehydrogenase family protein subunit M [Xanthobacteraceae bacterium]|nr:xanthine dehydrogenase family protein subunit M [Xanthobacteraceae bacterium]QYK45645.1 MAG: xanthine dehydrogenase family protein subunit M [Xanthobacteraceae bacterium]
MKFNLHVANSVEHAIEISSGLKDGWKYVAGGTDLVIQLRRGVRKSEDLVDISRLSSLREIEVSDDAIKIGALCTHKDIETNRTIEREFSALQAAARVVGGHQIRNVGTVGGNLANASPAADVAIALLSLDATIQVRGPEGSRKVPIDQLFVKSGETTLRAGELIESVQFKRFDGRNRSVFLKVGRRKAMEISVVSVAVNLEIDSGGTCSSARISLGAVGPRPRRAKIAERLIEKKKLDTELIKLAAAQAKSECSPRSDSRASAEYRTRVVEGLVGRALSQCL